MLKQDEVFHFRAFSILNTTETVAERVSFLEFVAVKQRREEKDRMKKNARKEEFASKLDEEVQYSSTVVSSPQVFPGILQKEKFERGEMGYGPDLYQLINNPMRNRKSTVPSGLLRSLPEKYFCPSEINITQGSRVLSTLRVDEAPKIAFDLQYMFKEKPRIQSELGNQMQYVISVSLLCIASIFFLEKIGWKRILALIFKNRFIQRV